MTRMQRIWHARVWLALSVLLAVGLGWALLLRRTPMSRASGHACGAQLCTISSVSGAGGGVGTAGRECVSDRDDARVEAGRRRVGGAALERARAVSRAMTALGWVS